LKGENLIKDTPVEEAQSQSLGKEKVISELHLPSALGRYPGLDALNNEQCGFTWDTHYCSKPSFSFSAPFIFSFLFKHNITFKGISSPESISWLCSCLNIETHGINQFLSTQPTDHPASSRSQKRRCQKNKNTLQD
jgi:hypothetical protein